MEQHPIPQNVTNFQFRLVGDITLKQFAYLAINIILAYVVTKINFVPVFLSYPLAGALVILGVCLAFVPIEERPLDKWLAAFVKSIYSPTYFIYKKQNQPPEILTTLVPPAIVDTMLPQKPVSQNTAREFMMSLPSSPVASPLTTTLYKTKSPPRPVPVKIPAKPVQVDKWNIGTPPVKPAKDATVNVSTPQVTGKKIVFEKPAESAAAIIQPMPQEVEKIKASYQQTAQKLTDQIASLQTGLKEGTIAKERFIEVQQVLSQLLLEKDNMAREIANLQKQLSQQSTDVEKPTTYKEMAKDTQTTVKMMSQGAAQQSGIPKLTNQPNVITGIIKDSRGTLLPNIIITIRDKESVPVRAFKTNRLGQFAASTPLSSGTYIIEAEDPKKAFQFHKIEVGLSNQVLPPLEISAVSEKDILRQKLSRELFGGNKI